MLVGNLVQVQLGYNWDILDSCFKTPHLLLQIGDCVLFIFYLFGQAYYFFTQIIKFSLYFLIYFYAILLFYLCL